MKTKVSLDEAIAHAKRQVAALGIDMGNLPPPMRCFQPVWIPVSVGYLRKWCWYEECWRWSAWFARQPGRAKRTEVTHEPPDWCPREKDRI